MNTNSTLMNELKNKQYREAYVASQIGMNLPFQIRALRKERGLSQGELAALAEMAQPRISEIEKPGERSLNLKTLLRVASGLDVGLQVRFLQFGELVDWSEGFDPDNFHVRSFADEVAALGGALFDVSTSEAQAIPLEEEGPAGDESREAAGPDIFDTTIMPGAALPGTQKVGTVQLSR